MNHLTYLKYDEYSNIYMINMEKLNDYILTIESIENIDILIEQWIINNCYFIILTKLIDGFMGKISQNLCLAKKNNDKEYIKYISSKLKINIEPERWEYVPNKIIVKIKKPILGGFKIDDKIAKVINVEPQQIFTHKSDITKLIHKYIYDNQLQNRYDRTVITPNDTLLTILKPLSENVREYTYFNLPSHIIGIYSI